MSKHPKAAARAGLVLTAFLAAASVFTDSYYLKSGSMGPEFPVGSIVVTTKLLAPKEGSVCAYQHNQMIIIHRIIEENAEGYRFKGDANNAADPYLVRKDQIKGRMLTRIPLINIFHLQEDFS